MAMVTPRPVVTQELSSITLSMTVGERREYQLFRGGTRGTPLAILPAQCTDLF
jgi:hypothetical protein